MSGNQYRIKANCPDGEYTGIMGGHVLEWEYEGKKVDCITDLGVRGINIPVKFRIQNGLVNEASIDPIRSN